MADDFAATKPKKPRPWKRMEDGWYLHHSGLYSLIRGGRRRPFQEQPRGPWLVMRRSDKAMLYAGRTLSDAKRWGALHLPSDTKAT